jgi:hypothetical protein
MASLMSEIEEKREENKTQSKPETMINKIRKFLTSVIFIFIIIILYFGSSGLVLYVCKLAQSNILPTESNCFPYTDTKPEIQNIKTNIFNTWYDKEMSMKLEFPYNEYNSSNMFLDMLREYKERDNSNFIANYFISIIDSLFEFNYSFINYSMNALNQAPEMLIILLGPIIVTLLFAFGLLINQFYFIYLWFVNMGWFFQHNENKSGQGKPKWESVSLLNPINWWIGVGLVVLFFILFFLGLPLLSFLPLFAVIWTIFSSVTYQGLMNGKSISALHIVKEVLKNYKFTSVSIISLFVVLLSFANLGAIPGLFTLFVLALIYWGILSIDLFKPISENNLSPLVSLKQAKKTCKIEGVEKHGWLYNLLTGSQNGGVNLTKELKNLSSRSTPKK